MCGKSLTTETAQSPFQTHFAVLVHTKGLDFHLVLKLSPLERAFWGHCSASGRVETRGPAERYPKLLLG